MKFYVLFYGSSAWPPGMLGNVISSYQAGFHLLSQLVPASESSGSETGPATDAVVVVVRSGTGIPFLHPLVYIARSRPRALERHRSLTIVHFTMKSAELLCFPGEFHPIKTRHRAAKRLPVDEISISKCRLGPCLLKSWFMLLSSRKRGKRVPPVSSVHRTSTRPCT